MKHYSKYCLLFSFLLVSLQACSIPYITRAGWEETKILWNRRPIKEIIKQDDISETEKKKLEAVLKARDFSKTIGLEPKKSFTQYTDIKRDVLVYVLTATPKNSFSPYTWWFPIVGEVPYKGFFDLEDAKDQARKLEKQGYDISIRPSAAFSTLGWFNDPLLSTTLQYSYINLISTVIHEILHSTVWIPNNVTFNETLATFVGLAGAKEFFLSQEDIELRGLAKQVDKELEKEPLFASFIHHVSEDLTEFYSLFPLDFQKSSPEEKVDFLEKRQALFLASIYDWELKNPQAKGDLKSFYSVENEINNAVIVAQKTYTDRPELFQKLFFVCNHSFKFFIFQIKELKIRVEKNNSDPYEELQFMIAELTPENNNDL